MAQAPGIHRPPSTASLFGRALLSGTLLFLAWPPLPFTFLLFVALVPWLQGIDAILASREGKGTIRSAWLFSYGMFLVWNGLTTWWVSLATLPGGIFAVLVNSLLMTVPVLVYLLARRRLGGVASGIALVSAWLGFEYLHMRWELTWPWLTLGNAFAGRPGWVQWYAFTGALGGSLWIWLVNGLVYRELGRVAEYALGIGKRYKASSEQKRRMSLLLAAVRPTLAVLLPILYSLWIYQRTDPQAGEPVDVALLQSDFDPHTEKFELPSREILERMVSVSEAALADGGDTLEYLVWPETALTENIDLGRLGSERSLNRIRALREPYPDLKVIVGINGFERFSQEPEDFPLARRFDFSNGKSQWIGGYNSAIQIGPGTNVPFYNKGLLVPGPECFPYYEQLRFIERFSPDVADYLGRLGRSKSRVTFLEDGQALDHPVAEDSLGLVPLGAAPAICYESIFGEYMTGWANNGARLFFVITNDGWWNNSPGRKQHLAYARLRAIECRRSVARSANTGISCFIDQRGDVVQAAAIGEERVLRGTMYANSVVTPYMRHGDLLGRTALWICAGMILLVISSWITGGFMLSRPNAPRQGLRPKR